MRALIAGAGGLLGEALQLARPSDWELIALRRSELDIVDPMATQAAIERHQPDVLVNCAAYTAVDDAETEVDCALAANATGPAHLARATASADIPLVHVSTDFVFDGAKATAYTESDPVSPLSVYGHTKAIGERAVRQHQPNHLIVRTAWLYGTRPPGFPHLLRRLSERGELRVVTDQRGSPTYAPHLAAAIFEALRKGARGTLHLAGSGSATRHEWAVELMKALKSTTPVYPAVASDFPSAALRPANSSLASEHPSGIVLPPWTVGLQAFADSLE